jgi:cell division septum initiation protein DivIVA
MITVLINENRDLQRRVDRLSRQAAGAPSAAADRILRALQRRVSTAAGLSSTSPARPTRRGPDGRTGRKITDPELLERRRQALVKARAARAAKRAQAEKSAG